ncbi:hypothetical protein ABB37_06381 [Leptomonas pyrrhocoris]|uniref:Uncharacterized protein n=1 Tax=Leptomonas pyrrhocoris TaxID=157538 RepID=A0A0M9FXM9_LEPPY|nr:hypothetical protein ABB37_06381 [Leptomonas pyrrhocoris]KPA78220.1 hypothetical protein ABB37_06381 [Leptomonas pyrrhocoris]|eukprot:XP_015656659.1 hypothetical protein ABB37_06381 [Leptomonas pyrrhocoris]
MLQSSNNDEYARQRAAGDNPNPTSSPQGSPGRIGLAYAALTPEREAALQAKGRQLLEEHRRESGGGSTYSPEEKEALQQRGMELLRAAREEAAANKGQHVPAPLLSAAARVAAATTAIRRREDENAKDGGSTHSSSDDDVDEAVQEHGATHLDSSQVAQAAPALAHSPPQQGEANHTAGKGVDTGAAPTADVQGLIAEVGRLQRLVAAQQDELSAAQASPTASPEAFTKAQMDAARQELIQQFNEHMAQCEQANQDYWAQVSADHRQEVDTLRQEGEALRRQMESLQTPQKTEGEIEAEAAAVASLQQAVAVLKQELDRAQQECTAAHLAREAAEQVVGCLTERLQEQANEMTQLQSELSAATAAVQAAREEAEKAAQADSAELQSMREHLLELERAYHDLQSMNAELQASNAKLEAAQTAAPAPAPPAPAHDAANPFADADAEDPFGAPSHAAPTSAATADDSELQASRKRIAELEAANAELQSMNAELQASNAKLEAAQTAAPAPAPPAPAHDAANPFADADAEDPFGAPSHAAPTSAATADDSELQASRKRIAELEAALAEAAADQERLQEDMEDKERLIQALRAGEAALGSLPADALATDHGWGITLPSDSVDGTPDDGAGSLCRSPDTLSGLRARVEEPTGQLEEERRACRQAQQQQQVASTQTNPPAPLSQMVPGMEELGRQYADFQHRLAIAEDAQAASEEEVRLLRESSAVHTSLEANGNDAPASPPPTSARVTQVLPAQPSGSSSSAAVGVNPFADAVASDEDVEAHGVATTVRGGRGTYDSIGLNPDSNHHQNNLSPLRPPLSEDDDNRNTPETQVSFHMGHDSGAAHETGGLVSDTVFGDAADVRCAPAAAEPFAGDPFSTHSREEEQSETQTTSAASRGDEVVRRSPRESGELLDEEEDTTEDVDASVSTRVTAARGRVPPVPTSKVEDSGAAMQELGRQYAEAQHRLLRSEEARQGLEHEVADLRQSLEQLQAQVHAQAAVADADAAPSDHSHVHFHRDNDDDDDPHPTSHSDSTHEGHIGNGLAGDGGDSEDEEEATRTVTTSFASSVPTAAQEQSSNPFAPSSLPPPPPHHADADDDALLGPPVATDAVFVERDGAERDHEGAEVIVADQEADRAVKEEDAAGVTVSLCNRIAELEAELKTVSANHEEELQALADAAADRIAALEQAYAAAATPMREADKEDDEVFGNDGDVTESQQQSQHRQNDPAAAATSSLSMSADPSPFSIAQAVAAARAEWEKSLEEERQEHAQLLHEVDALKVELEELKVAHEAELAALSAECNREIETHDELLRQRLEEQEESFEAAIQQLDQQHQDQLRVLVASAETALPTVREDDAADAEDNKNNNDAGHHQQAETAEYWKEQHDTLQRRFDQLQRDYDDFVQDTAALQRRLGEQQAAQQEQAQSRTTRDAAAQQLATLHERLADMTHLVEAAQADAQARSTELREATAQHTATVTALKEELTRLRTQAQSSHDEIAKLHGLNEELSELLQQGATGVEAALRDRDAQLSSLETQVRDLKQQLAASGDRLAERQVFAQEQRDACDKLQQEVEELKASNRTLGAQLREIKRMSEEQCRVAAQEAERAARDAAETRAAAQQALTEQHTTHQHDIAALQTQLDDLRGELEAAQTVAATVPLEAQKHQRDLEAVRARLTEALRSQQELQQQLKSSRTEVERQRRLLRGVNADGSEVSASSADGGGGGVPAGVSDARVNVLLRNVEELEAKLQDASAERDGLQQECDRVAMQLKSAARVAEVKEQAMRRQETELRSLRGQLATMRDDLGQRVQSNHALQLEMDHLQERVEDLAVANAELQEQHSANVESHTTQEHAEALLFAKAMTIPRALEDHVSELYAAYHALLQLTSKDRAYVYGRCDTIEKAAGEAMAEAEAQNNAYEVALTDAQEEQQQLKEIIEHVEEALHKTEDAAATAVAEAKAAKEELEAVQRQAREDVFQAQRDLQVAELQHADTLHSLSLLQDEVTNTAALIKNQKATYERREAELAAQVSQLQAETEARKTSARLLQQSTDEALNELQDFAEQAGQERDQAVRETQALRAQLERALPRLAQLEDEQAQRTADLMDTAQQLSALHKKSSSTEEVSRKHIEELNQTLAELLHAHAVLQRTHTTTEATADRLKTQLETATQELTRTSAKARQQEEEATLLRDRLQEVETRTSQIILDDQARLHDAERRIQGFEQRNAALQKECKSLQEAQQSLRVELESTADALQRTTETSKAQEQQQNHQLRLLRERADTLEAERQELMTSEQAITKERDACQREILQLQHRMELLQHHLGDANEHNDTLNHELVELKTEHATELDRLRVAITDAQKELAKCRQLLAEAESRQVEQDGAHYSLTTEMNVLREELKSARVQAEKAMQQYQKEKAERAELAALLQAQIAQLHEELRSKQEQLRGVESTAASQAETISVLRQDVAEASERLRHTRKELLDVQEAANAAKEHHRRDRYELQSKLNNAEDTLAELQRQHEQYRGRMTTKAELYEVAEQALRAEVTDLRADVARLEEALTVSTQGKAAVEDEKSRQAHSIKAVESEVQTLRAQTAADMTELTALRVQLQQRTAEVDRTRREGAAQLAGEKLKWEAEHAAACDALEEALRKAQQAAKDSREAREHALATLDRKQKEVTAVEEECRALRVRVRQLQRRVEAAGYQLAALEGMAKDSAADLGVSLGELVGGTITDDSNLTAPEIALDASSITSGGASSSPGAGAGAGAGAAAAAAVQAVLDELVRRLNVYTFAANTLDIEDAQLAALLHALEQHQNSVDVLTEVSSGEDGGGGVAASYSSGVTPMRDGGAALGLNTTPAARGGPVNSHGGKASGHGLPARSLTAAQQIAVQQISQASSTFVHRVEDHVRTAQQMLRAVVMAVGAQEVVAGSAAAPDSSLNTRPSTVALSTRHKLQVAATIAELHRRTATLTRAVDRVTESIVGSPTSTNSASAGAPAAAANLQAALQELRRLFAEAERHALLPFNELLCSSSAAAAAAGEAGSAPAGTGTASAAGEASYGARGRQGKGKRTPPRTQPQPPLPATGRRSPVPVWDARRAPVEASPTPMRDETQQAPPSMGDVAIVSAPSPIPPDEGVKWL